MGLNYQHLDARTRAFMLEEIELDIAEGKLFLSPWFTDQGELDWPQLVRNAAQGGTDDTLAAQLRNTGRLAHTRMRKKRNSTEMTPYKVPVTAPETIAEGEFNRFYVRGLCRRAIEDNIDKLIVYRAKAVLEPRPGSEAKIGMTVAPGDILRDLRATIGVEPALGLPPGPNSGLTLKLP